MQSKRCVSRRLIVCAAILLVCTLAACGQPGTPEQTETPEPGPTVTSEPTTEQTKPTETPKPTETECAVSPPGTLPETGSNPLDQLQSYLDAYRMTCYLVGLGFSLTMAGRLFSIDHPLGRLFGTVMASWAIVCLAMMLLLLNVFLLGHTAAWRWLLMTFVGTLLWVVPVVLSARFSNMGDQTS